MDTPAEAGLVKKKREKKIIDSDVKEEETVKFWLLRPVKSWSALGRSWECTDKFIVRASDEAQARQLAAAQATREVEIVAENPWLSAEHTTCTMLDENGPAEVIAQEYHEA